MTRPASSDTSSVVVLYNQVGDDVYEKLRHLEPPTAETLGFEPEYDVAVSTVIEEYKELARALRRQGYRVRLVNLSDDLRRFERLLRRNPPDVVLNLVEHFHDEAEYEAHAAAFLELHRVAYTGAPPFALTLCSRKGLTKQLLASHGIPTPRFTLLHEPKIAKRHGLRYPLIVKPSWADASAGVDKESVVHDHATLTTQLLKTYEDYGEPMLVEEFIEGRELHVAVLGNDPPEVLPPLEYDFSDLPDEHPKIISYDAKWNPLEEVFHRVHTVCPAPLTKAAWTRVQDVCLQAYHVTGCRDYARLDLRLASRGRPFVLEVNPNPDLTEGVSFMESAAAAGYEFGETLARIVEFALERVEEPEAQTTPEPEIKIPEPIQRTLTETPSTKPQS